MPLIIAKDALAASELLLVDTIAAALDQQGAHCVTRQHTPGNCIELQLDSRLHKIPKF